ncbi:MAG: tRNA (adenosine(37)-N6)-threonylcarbamoyltransferase complex dimerization subunit type 1 TsaB, partial [Ruminococcus sp.]|nr:tRNA (adenosine(37)-N6)-threonylcarbamoyltransferase complex dimerization subunit type 1 TsaB [Ruminococcus sp.]
MLILGIDTSGKTASAALFDSDNEIFVAENTVYTQKTHSQVIMPIVKNILAQTGKTMQDINLIAAADGPGSYTGLRIGVAAVKAMSFALDVRCCGVSTLKALAYNNIAFRGVICSVMKARAEL